MYTIIITSIQETAIYSRDGHLGSGDGSLIRSIGIIKPSPNPTSLDPSELAFAA